MVRIKPFKAVRPDEKYAKDVAAHPYDVMSSKEARVMVVGNDKSFLRIDRAEVNFDESVNQYSKEVYQKAREVLDGMISNGIFKEEEKECFYIYEEIFNGNKQRGLVMCSSIDDYIENKIKKHEFTRAQKERDRINHVDYCNANTGPIFLTYRRNENITNKINEVCDNQKAIYDFESDDTVRHIIWKVEDKKDIDYLVTCFETVENLYIADGHHRTESAVKVGTMRRGEHPNYNGSEEFNYFLAVAFPNDELKIMDYNRVAKVEADLTVEDLIDKLKQDFVVNEFKGEGCYRPYTQHYFGMYFKNKWYELIAKEGSFDKNNVIESLDVSILENNVIKPILGIKDMREDKRIDFVGGIRGLKELEKRVNDDMDIAFSMYPTNITELMEVSDQGLVMPPKSTWFEPKLRSGLFIHKL